MSGFIALSSTTRLRKNYFSDEEALLSIILAYFSAKNSRNAAGARLHIAPHVKQKEQGTTLLLRLISLVYAAAAVGAAFPE